MIENLTSDQILIRKLTDIVLSNLSNENFGVNELIKASGLSLYRISRTLNSIKKITINQFIREVRLQKAKELLQNESFSVSEVAYRVGFSSPAYFNTCFREFFGYPPGKVRENGLKSPEEEPVKHFNEKHEEKNTIRKSLINNLSVIVLVAFAFLTVIYIAYPGILSRNMLRTGKSSGEKVSIAVLPFKNMTGDTTMSIWQDAIQQSLITSLSSTGELRVRQKENINTILQSRSLTNYAAVSPTAAQLISKKLDADMFIYGNLQKAGKALRIDAQLIDTRTREVLKSFRVDELSGEMNSFLIIDTLSRRLRNFLIISKLIRESPDYSRFPPCTTSPEAFRYCIYGDAAKNTAINKEGYTMAIDWYLKALEIDSNFYSPMDGLSFSYANLGMMEESLKWIKKTYEKRDQWPVIDQLSATAEYVSYFGSPDEKIRYLKQMQQIDDQTPGVSFVLGVTYNELKQYDKAIPELEKAISIYHEWGINDSWYYSQLGYAYHKTGQFRKEKALYKKAEKYVRDDQWIIARRAVLSLSEKDSVEADSYIEKYTGFCRSNSIPEAEIALGVAVIYREADIPEKAEEYYRKAIDLDPDNPALLNSFAAFLSKNNGNPAEFTGIIDKAIRLAGNKWDYYNYSDTKGYGLFELGMTGEALDILQKTWDETPFKIFFVKSHLEEVKKAVAGNGSH